MSEFSCWVSMPVHRLCLAFRWFENIIVVGHITYCGDSFSCVVMVVGYVS